MDTTELGLRVCEALDTPLALSVAIQLRYGAWDLIASNGVDPGSYIDPQRFLLDKTAVDLLRKNRSLKTSFNKRSKAIENFYKAESMCRETNKRLCPLELELLYGIGSTHDGDFLRDVRREVLSIIGPSPDYTFIVEHGRFGPGATLKDVGKLSTVADKMSTTPACTDSRILALFPELLETAWFRARPPFRHTLCDIVDGNRFVTVPKDGTTDRGICIEPSVNVYLQLGCGELIRRRLKNRAGLDLLNAQPLQREAARIGSQTGTLGTIDLSMASDTVSKMLVKLLFPEKWYRLLCLLRSPSTLIEGESIRVQKFSSMGNGFTFELETLIFLSILRACARRRDMVVEPLVFGDDIICPSELYDDVVSALTFCGFTPNLKKSFHEGPFRESCGGDYFLGKEVRPFYVKEDPTQPSELITLANQIYHLGTNHLIGRRLGEVHRWVLNQIPTGIRRCVGPSEFGDIVIRNDDEASYTFKEQNGIRWLRCWRSIPNRVGLFHFTPDVQLASAVYGAANGDSFSVDAKGVSGYRFGRVSWS